MTNILLAYKTGFGFFDPSMCKRSMEGKTSQDKVYVEGLRSKATFCLDD